MELKQSCLSHTFPSSWSDKADKEKLYNRHSDELLCSFILIKVLCRTYKVSSSQITARFSAAKDNKTSPRVTFRDVHTKSACRNTTDEVTGVQRFEDLMVKKRITAQTEPTHDTNHMTKGTNSINTISQVNWVAICSYFYHKVKGQHRYKLCLCALIRRSAYMDACAEMYVCSL